MTGLLARHRHPAATEHQEQTLLCRWLDLHGIRYFAVPNGARVRPNQARKLKREGLRPGAPDLVIVSRLALTDQPGDWTEPVVVEMKRKGGKLSPVQRQMHAEMGASGWTVIVAHGADEAIAQLGRLGYGQNHAPGAPGWRRSDFRGP